MDEASESDAMPPSPISGSWRRIGAFLVDGVVLGLVGSVMGYFWSDEFAGMGTDARVFGFVPAWLYFGLLNSQLTAGQTIGKRFLGIRVVDRSGEPIAVHLSLVRFLPLGLPWFLNGLWLSVSELQSWVVNVLSFVILGIGGSLIYLFIFNRNTRQSIHDLLVGSFVVRAESSGVLSPPPVWRLHLVACAFLLVVAVVAPIFTKQLVDTGPFPALLQVQERVNSLPWVIHAQPTAGTQTVVSVKEGSSTTTYFSIVAYITSDDINSELRAAEVIATAIESHPKLQENEVLQVTLVYGYDIGIASGWQQRSHSDTASNWIVRAAAL